MHGNEDHFVKWNKSGLQRQKSHDLSHMWNLKTLYLIEVESRLVVNRGWGQWE
jgi:hypothetical protein